MATSLWWSFVETITPGTDHPAQESGESCNHMVGDETSTHEEESDIVTIPVYKAALEHSGATDDPLVAQPRGAREIAMGEVEPDSEEDSTGGDHSPPKDLASQIAVWRTTPTPETHQQGFKHPHVQQAIGVKDLVGDILQDAKLYQDAAIEYQSTYKALQKRYSEQVCLMQEASGALLTAESQASQKQQELLDLQK